MEGLVITETTDPWDIPISPSLRRDQVLALFKLALEADDDLASDLEACLEPEAANPALEALLDHS